MCDEGCFLLVAIFDVDIVVSLMNVKFSEVVRVFQLVHKVEDKEKGVCILGGMFIEIAVILAREKFAILLDKEEGGYLGRIGRTNLSSS